MDADTDTYIGWTQRTLGKVTRPQMERTQRPQIQQETDIKFHQWSLYVTFKSGRYLEPGGGTELQLTPRGGWPGGSPPQGKVGFQELAGWQETGSARQAPHTLPPPPHCVYFGCHWARSDQLSGPISWMNRVRLAYALVCSPPGSTRGRPGTPSLSLCLRVLSGLGPGVHIYRAFTFCIICF